MLETCVNIKHVYFSLDWIGQKLVSGDANKITLNIARLLRFTSIHFIEWSSAIKFQSFVEGKRKKFVENLAASQH